ncbi:MAG: hypothetical protein AAF485_03185 [Chloroflexota bacterium]
MKNSKLPLIIGVFVIPAICVVVGLFVVLAVGFISNDGFQDSAVAGVDQAQIESNVLTIAADYSATNDLEAARSQLDTLGVPNPDQYISFMVDRYLQERGSDDADTLNLFLLANALGSTSSAMASAFATATPIATATEAATATPLPTETPTLAPTVEEQAEAASDEGASEEAAEETTSEEVVEATEEPTQEPTEEPTATPAPTDTPEPTATLGPPTNTPEPTATPEPEKPAVDFVLNEAYLIPNPNYGTCPGSHQIFVTVLDANGSPLDGVKIEDTFRAVPPKTSGDKGPGKAEYDLWNNGFAIEVTASEDGSPAASDVTPKLSSWDEDIPDEWLVQANYCSDLNDCQIRKSSNQLCRGHYSYNVTFQKTY